MLRRLTLVATYWAALLAGCGDPAAPAPPPTSVVIVSATLTSLHLRNEGGAGEFILEAWGRSTKTPPPECAESERVEGRCPITATLFHVFEPIEAGADYDAVFVIVANDVEVYGFKVFSRSAGEAGTRPTGCQRVESGAWLTFGCP